MKEGVVLAQKKLHIGEHFTVPLEAVTETFLVLGQRGGGKTNTAAVIAEELFRVGAPFSVMTPIDNWWGLKSSADGKGPGLPIYIFGGRHGDLPLQPTAGRLMADVLIEQRISCVICTDGFSGRERAAFTTDFAERLLQKNREPLHIIVEEADAFIPQSPFKGEERMLGAMDRLIRWGRNPSGIGGTFICQRSAKINKDVTTQCSVLVAHRTMAEQDIDAIKGWFKYHPNPELQKQLLSEIAMLSKGSAFFYSPAWLEYFGQVAVRRRETFDSAATPKLGDVRVEPKRAAQVDLKVLEKKMAETIEKVKADDPAELRKQIIALKQELAAKAKSAPSTSPAEVRELQQQLKSREKDWVETLRAKNEIISNLERRMAKILAIAAVQESRVAEPPPPIKWSAPTMTAGATPSYTKAPTHKSEAPPQSRAARTPSNGIPDRSSTESLGRMPRALLTALAQHPEGLAKKQILLHAGYAASGDISVAFAGFVREGWMVESAGLWLITEAGLAALGPFELLPLGDELRRSLLEGTKLSTVERRLLSALCEVYPEALRRGQVVERAGYKPSGDISVAFAKLVRLGYAVDVREGLQASAVLFG